MSFSPRVTRFVRLLIVGLLCVSTGAVVATRQLPVTAAINRGVITAIHFDISRPLTEMARDAPTAGIEAMENPDPPAGPEVALDSTDRDPDLIWQDPTGRAVIWVMNGTTYTGDARYLYAGATEWILKGGADYTLDGKLDLIWQHPTGTAVIWVMDGTAYGGDARYLYSAPTEWKVVPR